MKRFWVGVGLLGAMLILGIWTGQRMIRSPMPCAQDLEQAAAQAMAEDWTAAGALSDRARETWEQNRKFSASVANHRVMDEIDALFRELEIYRAREETAAYSAECMYLAERLRDLGNSFRLNLWNLL